MSGAYYNEIDDQKADWLRTLMMFGHIAPGEIDTRDIRDVSPDDLRGFTQHHFFAGIGGWSYSARLAGWPDDRPLATLSCPCQPFSEAGPKSGFADERHLWPAAHHLVRECRFSVVLGEQVATKAGRAWLDLVCDDMEGSGYSGGAVATVAAGYGAPIISERLYLAWLAEAAGERREGAAERTQSDGGAVLGHCSEPRRLDALWREPEWLTCEDDTLRPVEPGSFPLAHGIPARMGRLRGYGDAINTAQAAAFIQAVMETIECC